MITTNSRIEGKKVSGLMLPPRLRTKSILKTKDTQETFLGVQDAPYITQEFALSSVRLATRSGTCSPSTLQISSFRNAGTVKPTSRDFAWGAPFLFVKKKDESFRMCIDYRE
ncbi:hypothetical protein Tco_0588133 [Tanacetum coccineum]